MIEIKKSGYRVYLAVALLLFSPLLCSFEVIDPDFGQYMGLDSTSLATILFAANKSEAPRQIDDLVVFMNKPENPARYIGIAFAHEDFNKIHLFAKQNQGVYYFLYKVTGKESYLDYRLVVDGVWLSDDTHSGKVNDFYGHEISRINIDSSQIQEKLGPQSLGGGRFLFRYKGQEGSRVFLNSDIGSWDPFRYRMNEVQPGVYEATLRMTQGEHYYYFLENGEKLLGNVTWDIRVHPVEGDVNVLTVG